MRVPTTRSRKKILFTRGRLRYVDRNRRVQITTGTRGYLESDPVYLSVVWPTVGMTCLIKLLDSPKRRPLPSYV